MRSRYLFFREEYHDDAKERLQEEKRGPFGQVFMVDSTDG